MAHLKRRYSIFIAIAVGICCGVLSLCVYNAAVFITKEIFVDATNDACKSSDSLLDYYICLMLSVCLGLFFANKHQWNIVRSKFIWYYRDLHASNVGIIGLGNIGKALSKRLYFGFNCNVYYYIPTRYDASGFFSYPTWDDKSDTVRLPDEERVVRTGPPIWHWSWDLSFGVYDDIYDKIQNNNTFTNNKYHKSHSDNCKDKDLFLEETWLNLEGPIASWQPLFAAIIWFIISMNILFPLSMISQNTKYPYHTNNDDINHKDIHITSNYSHFQVGLILFSFEISSWITTPISSFFILRIGPSLMLFIGILLMIISSVAMSFSYMFYNLQFVIYLIIFRILSGIGFNTVRQSSLFLWSCFAKLDMLASGLGFCVGPVFGDLLYVYLGFKVAYIIYSCILFILLLLPLLIIIIFKLLSLQQIGQLEIPSHIKNIRKPRYDLYNIQNNTMRRSTFYNCKSILLLVWKLEILCSTIIGLTALEPTLPIYALDPSLDITVSGALFTFIYLPLLALIGLIYAKSSSKFLNSPIKHVKFTRRGMKYITKTLSINLSGMGQSKSQQHNNNNCNKRFNVSKSEKIKFVQYCYIVLQMILFILAIITISNIYLFLFLFIQFFLCLFLICICFICFCVNF